MGMAVTMLPHPDAARLAVADLHAAVQGLDMSVVSLHAGHSVAVQNVYAHLAIITFAV